MRSMFVLVAATVIFGFASCTQKEKELTPAQIKAKADSTVASQMPDLKREAAVDLDRRSTIEVKAITDSIVNAYMQSQSPQPVQASQPQPPQPATQQEK